MLRGVLLLWMVVLVVVLTACDRAFAGNRRSVAGDGGVALLWRRCSIIACSRMHGWVCGQGPWRKRETENTLNKRLNL